MSTICIIPARGGSKRIPHKNIRLFRGKPIIGWSIEAAKATDRFDHIIVSTDDDRIAEVAKKFGASVPFLRPAHLSDDFTGTTAVVNHAIAELSNRGLLIHSVCCLYSTAPFVRAVDLEAGYLKWLQLQPSRPVFTATSYPSAVQRAFILDLDGCAQMLDPDSYYTRSQDLPVSYHDAGQFYWGSPSQWLTNPEFSNGCVPLTLPRWRVQDIDTEEDWHCAELLHQLLDR